MSQNRFTFQLIKSSVIVLALLLIPGSAFAQDNIATPEAYDSAYAVNITLSRINDVYIPTDVEDAHARIIALTPPEALEQFSLAPEKEVSRKLHFGIGRWMIINWNFYDGSRLSHHLKQKGLLHPDDMAQYLLRTLHRKLNAVDSGDQDIIDELEKERLEEVNEVYINKKN